MSDGEDNHKASRRASRDGDSGIGGGGGAEAAQETSPGEAYTVFVEMSNLANKLKLLNYDDEYLLRWKMKPLSK